jgi:hypothetical protein
MNSMNIRITAPEQLEIVKTFAETMQMPLTKAVVLAVMLANKYQKIELENRALRQALASTQSTNEDFYAFVNSEIGKN